MPLSQTAMPFISAGAGLLGGLFGGGGETEYKKLDRLSPEQQQALKDYFKNPLNQQPLYQSGNSYLMNLLSNNPESYAAFEAPLMQQFREQVIPQISERFAGLGTGAGGLNSSALYSSLGKAASDFSTNLAQLRGNMQMQALPQALAYANQPYATTLGALGVSPYEYVAEQNQGGAGGQFAQIFPSALMAGLNSFQGSGFNKSGSTGFGNTASGWNTSMPSQYNYSPNYGMNSFNQMNNNGFTYR